MKKIAIIGLGLIGASLLRALQNKDFELIAISSTLQTLEKIKRENLASVVSSDLKEAKDADVVFVCTPISTVISMLDKLSKIVSKNTLITDVSSVKEFVCEHAKNLDIKFVGSHPMAGTEHKGFDSAQSDLFEGAKWVLTPCCDSLQSDIELLKSIIDKTGAKILVMDAKEHDEAAALISHVPMILSQSLFYILENYEKENIKEAAKKLASSGFRDMTRLAGSNSQMALDMLEFNKKNILSLMNQYSVYSKNFLNDYSFEMLEKLIIERKKMYSKEGKNIY